MWQAPVSYTHLAKKIKAFTLFVSRDAMNIDGLSEIDVYKRQTTHITKGR